ncbi:MULTISPECIES: hypothetical protein [Clostridium]|uniref:hypothetical protein n=1 Tax=Clostridium TaxID=1485 RepID=UPI000CDA5EEC|nr:MULTISPECIES: hypothetical protein [Clostridium]MBN7573664.1 hypothetical protein [Clostridium beijerinckii]MBN7578922.1 hypothetical protein [Clostridium beijerinckii]MBN7583295.1 hypothetical protein [Clostridium beijerinckii]MBO0521227.1 hypothetical protein [Clostridium beijerinckii]MZK52621.1 hypothetical protein [Clostridium beijerinckii]
MNQIQSKIYYDINTGQVLVITPEMQGSVEKTTKEQDIEMYPQLKDKSIDEIDFIELEYGTLDETFKNIKSYSVDVENKKFNPIYLTQEELDAIQQQFQEEQELSSRASDISTYLLNVDSTTIADIENSILEIEKNKVINGGI